MSRTVRVAVLGAGRIGKRHARTLAGQTPNAELVAIADANEQTARDIAADLKIDTWTTDSATLIGDPNVDAVVIASSTDSHAPLIIAAAEAGKDIFCEKPIALDLETTDRAIDRGREGRSATASRFQPPLSTRATAAPRPTSSRAASARSSRSATPCAIRLRRRDPMSPSPAACSGTWRSTTSTASAG